MLAHVKFGFIIEMDGDTAERQAKLDRMSLTVRQALTESGIELRDVVPIIKYRVTRDEAILLTERKVHLRAADRPTHGPFANDRRYIGYTRWGICGAPASKITDNVEEVTCKTCLKLKACEVP